MPQRACDVVIVGGGPAGSTCARELTRAGADVVVLDRAAFPRDKPCAGWLTPDAWRAADLSPDDYRQGRVVEAIRGFEIGLIGGDRTAVDYGEVVSYAVRRREFDACLLERSGARVVRHHVGRVTHVGGDWVVDDEWRAPVLVGAGGTSCPVARLLLRHAVSAGRLVLATCVEFELPGRAAASCPIAGERPALFFGDDRQGYGWCVRKGAWLNVGFGRVADDEFHERERAFREWLRCAVIPGLDVPDRWPGHAYRLWSLPARPLTHDGALLVGDSAGLADPVSGEGIGRAIESGSQAACAIVAAGGRASPPQFAGYETWTAYRCGPRHASAVPRPAVTRVLAPVTRYLLTSPWFARHVLLDRWFLHRTPAATPP